MKNLMMAIAMVTLTPAAFATGKYPASVSCEVVRTGEDSSDGEVYLYNSQFDLALKAGSYIHTDEITGTDYTITSFIAAGSEGNPNWIRVDVASTKTREILFMNMLELVSKKVPLMLHVDFPTIHARVDCRTRS